LVNERTTIHDVIDLYRTLNSCFGCFFFLSYMSRMAEIFELLLANVKMELQYDGQHSCFFIFENEEICNQLFQGGEQVIQFIISYQSLKEKYFIKTMEKLPQSNEIALIIGFFRQKEDWTFFMQSSQKKIGSFGVYNILYHAKIN
jgi:hypothetical protein